MRRLSRFLLFAALCLGPAAASSAGQLSTLTQILWNGQRQGGSTQDGNTAGSAHSEYSAHDPFTYQATNGSFDGDARAYATYGVVEALTHERIFNGFGQIDHDAFARATFEDTLTFHNGNGILGDHGSGQFSAAYLFAYALDLSGATLDGFKTSSVSLSVFSGNSENGDSTGAGINVNQLSQVIVFPNAGPNFTTRLFSFDYGTPFLFNTTLDSRVELAGTSVSSPFFVDGLSDGFSFDARLDHFLVTDDQGNPVSGVTLEAESGTAYQVGAAVGTPVPSTLVMSSILFGMFGAVWSYKRLKQTAMVA